MLNYKLQKQVNFRELVYKKGLSVLDFYGSPIQIQIKGQQQFSTCIGLTVSLVIIATCLLVFWQDLNRAIYQSRPQVYSSEVNSIETQPIELDFNNFTMAILLLDNNLKSIDGLSTVYNLQVFACKRNRVDNNGNKISPVQSCQQLNTESCQIGVHFVTPQQRKYFKNFNMTNIHCVSPNQPNDAKLFLQGSGSSNQFQYIKINIASCKNETSNNTCQSQKQIDAKLSYGNYAIYMLDNLVDMNIPGNPYSMTTYLFYTSFSNGASKNIYSTYKQSLTNTDDGFVTSQSNQFGGIIQNGQQESQQPLNSDFFIQHSISLDQKQINYYRSFQKLQIVFGSLGGLWNVLYHLCFVFMFPLVKKLMYLEIINKIFTFDEENAKTPIRSSMSKFNITPSLIKATPSTTVSSNMNKTLLVPTPQCVQDSIFKFRTRKVSTRRKQSSNVVIKSQDQLKRISFIQKINNTEDIRNYLKSKQSSLIIGLRSVIALVFCCQLKKEKAQIDYGVKKISQKLDVFYIIRKLFEIEKLKMVLLNDEQQKIFNYLPKPCIPHDLHQISNGSPIPKVIKEYEKKPQFKPMIQEEETELKRVSNAYEAYKTIQASQYKSDLDRQLILCLDQDITSLFEQLILKEDLLCDEKKMSGSLMNSHMYNSPSPGSPKDQQILSSPISKNKLMLKILSKQADSCEYLNDD